MSEQAEWRLSKCWLAAWLALYHFRSLMCTVCSGHDGDVSVRVDRGLGAAVFNKSNGAPCSSILGEAVWTVVMLLELLSFPHSLPEVRRILGPGGGQLGRIAFITQR